MLVAFAFFCVMAPESSGMRTLRPVFEVPLITSTARTHTRLSALDTVVDVATPVLDEAKPKSAGATPVTALSKVAVNVMELSVTVAPLAPCDDEKVGVGGSYLQ